MLKSRLTARQKGNVLFIILIAIALFTALTYAVSRSSQGTSNANAERGTINATDYMSYGSAVEKTVSKMLTDDISESGLSFENSVWKNYGGADVMAANAMCTAAPCKVFDMAGGGLTPKTFAAESVGTTNNSDIQSGHGGVFSMKIAGVGTAARDVVLLIAIVNDKTCMEINKQLGIANGASGPPADSWANAPLYPTGLGAAGPGDGTDEIGDVATAVSGKSAGCVNRTGGYGAMDNYFYQVLLPR